MTAFWVMAFWGSGWGGFGGDDLDFYEGVLGERGHGYGGAGGGDDAFGGQVFGVDLVHDGEVGHALEEDGGFDYVGEVEAGFVKDSANVLEDADGLLGDASGDELAGGGVEGNLSGEEEHASDANGLRVRADGGGCFAGGDGDLSGDGHGPFSPVRAVS